MHIGLPVEFSCRPGADSRRSTTGGRCEIHSAPPRKGALADHPALASPKTSTGNPRKPRTEGKPAARRHVSAELPATQATRRRLCSKRSEERRVGKECRCRWAPYR